jgi:hypothetical protein
LDHFSTDIPVFHAVKIKLGMEPIVLAGAPMEKHGIQFHLNANVLQDYHGMDTHASVAQSDKYGMPLSTLVDVSKDIIGMEFPV